MKKILNFSFLLGLLISANFIVSCSTDNETIATHEPENSFFKTFYGQDVRFGKTADVSVNSSSTTSRSASTTNYTITEVFVGNETVARGYDVINKNTREALFFVDIDRSQHIARIYDHATSQITILTNIDKSTDYSLTREFDLIYVITDPRYNEPPQNEINGWVYTYGAPYMYGGKCYKAVYRHYEVFGIKFTKSEPVKDDNGNNLAIPCGDTYP